MLYSIKVKELNFLEMCLSFDKLNHHYYSFQLFESCWYIIELFQCRWYVIDEDKSQEVSETRLTLSDKVLTHLEDVGQQLALAFNYEGSALAAGGEVDIVFHIFQTTYLLHNIEMLDCN